MSYTVPNFNLLCNLWHGSAFIPPQVPPDESEVACQLYLGHQDGFDVTPFNTQAWRRPVYIRLPKGTDVRFSVTDNQFKTLIECPADSGRFYGVVQVEDAHKGFPNEYRVAIVTAANDWPIPIP